MKIKTIKLVKMCFNVTLSLSLVFSLLPSFAHAEKPPMPDINLMLLAAGERSTILSTTPINTTINHNGSEWYNNTRSIGFANAGSVINQSNTDINDPSDTLRLSWRRTSTLVAGGTRLGNLTNLNNSSSYMRLVFESNNIPEYYPSGPQTNVSLNSLEGWSLCYYNYYRELITVEQLWNSCSGDYLLLAGAEYTDLSYKLDIKSGGVSVLEYPGGLLNNYARFYEGNQLQLQLYDPSVEDIVEWNSYKLFTELCIIDECSRRGNPVNYPEDWDDGVMIDSEFTVPSGSAGKRISIYPVDSSNGEIIKTSSFAQLEINDIKLIDSCETLMSVGSSSRKNDYLFLENDIDCTNADFEPIIFEDGAPFGGVFDGNNKTIKNLSVNQPLTFRGGLFGIMESALVKNLSITDVLIESTYEAGVIAGLAYGLSMDNVYINKATINVSGECENVGGLVGQLDNGGEDIPSISRVSFDGDINASDCTNVGGVFGYVNGSNISRAQSSGTINGGSEVGGLVGLLMDSIVHESTSDSSVVSLSDNAGGLVGYNNIGGDIKRSYALGTTLGVNNIGGLVGNNEGSIENSYSKGHVDGNGSVGGLIGLCSGAVSNSYTSGLAEAINEEQLGGLVGISSACNSNSSLWDVEASRISTSPVGDGKSTMQLLSRGTYEDLSWNFDSIWKIDLDVNDGYPCHQWDELYCVNDGDNVSTLEENGSPNEGDGNKDGVLDSIQSNVTSFINDKNGKYITLAFDTKCKTTNADSISESTDLKDSGFDYPFGLISFTTNCLENEKIVSVKIYYHSVVVPDLPLRKYNPNNGAYFNLDSFTKTSITSYEQVGSLISYDIQEGSELDIDNQTNGIIVDPVGFGELVVGVPNTGFGYIIK